MRVKTTARTERRKGHAVTIHEVAKHAGVSLMTVSRVMNSNSNVREATRELVMRLAAAQGTRIALIYTNPSAAYLSELLVGALAGAGHTAAQLVLDTWDHMSHAAERAAARKIAQSVAGVVLPPPLCESKVVLSELAAAGIPVMAIASGRFQPDLSSVRIDDFRASQEMTEHLIAMGHARIAFIRGHPNQTASTLRYDGFHAAMTAAGLTIDPALIQQGYFTYRSGLEATEKLLTRKNPPTAIFASNDDMAAAAVSVAHRRGLDVPRDLSVVGFDDTPTATTVWPELTTVRQPIAAMAGSAVELLLRSISQRKDGDARVVSDHVMAHVLIKRDSVAAPRKG
jgi:LacI family transcriptional regulator, galactose operon repressor